MHRRNNQNELGGEDWERALALRDQLVREHPDDFLYRRDLAQTRLNLGNWYSSAAPVGAGRGVVSPRLDDSGAPGG